MPPPLPFPDLCNARDLGGYPTLDGRLTRTHSLVRADDLWQLTPAGLRAVADYPIETVVDLRWPAEAARDPNPARALPGVRFAHVSLLTHTEDEWHLRSRDVAKELWESPLRERRRAGLAYIPEDRAVTGTALAGTAAANLSLGFHRAPPLARGIMLDGDAMRRRARALIERFSIKIPNETVRVGTLSGGNLQKVVAARELAHEAAVVIAEQPTRGLDVGATEYIHQAMVAQRDAGRAVLLISSELSEIMALADRILVMYEGRIVADLAADAADEAKLGLLMAGVVGHG